jgi:hypothetical protein
MATTEENMAMDTSEARSTTSVGVFLSRHQMISIVGFPLLLLLCGSGNPIATALQAPQSGHSEASR